MKNKMSIPPKPTKSAQRPRKSSRAKRTELHFAIFDFSPYYENAESLLSKHSDEKLRSLLSEDHPLILRSFDVAIKTAREIPGRTEKDLCDMSRLALRALVLEERDVLMRIPAESDEEIRRAQSQLYELGRVNNWKPLLLSGQKEPAAFYPPPDFATNLVLGWVGRAGHAIQNFSESDRTLITTSQCPQAQFIRATSFSFDFLGRFGVPDYPNKIIRIPPYQHDKSETMSQFLFLIDSFKKDGESYSKALTRSALLMAADLQGQKLGDVLRNNGINTANPQLGEKLKNGKYRPTNQEARDFSGFFKGLSRDPKLSAALTRGENIAAGRKLQSDANAEKRHAEWPQYTEYLISYFQRNPKHSLTNGRKACAKNYEVSLKTIERRTKGYNKPA